MTIQEIKKSAKMNLKGNYWRCASASLIYFIIVVILSFILEFISTKLQNYTIPLTIIQAIFALISSVLSYGLIATVLDLSSGKTKSITKVIDKTILNFTKYVKIILNILIRILVPLLIFLFCILYLIGTTVAYISQVNFLCFYSNLVPLAIIICLISFIVLIYFILKYTLSAFIFYNNSELSAKDVVQKSNELMKKQKIRYIGLIFSFAGWVILMAIILYILGFFIDAIWMTPLIVAFYSLIRPYIITSESNFYESLGETKTEEIKE